MLSRAERPRAERALRLVAWAALIAWIANAARPALTHVDVATDATLAGALPRWSRDATVDSVHAQLDTVPGPVASAWLAALGRAGVGVSWSGPRIPATALEVHPAVDPAGGVLVHTSAPSATTRIVSDALGPLDTLRGPAASVVRFASMGRDVVLAADRQWARADVAPFGAVRRVFVTGAAGWEAKFVIAALEEAGWAVDARVFIAPERDVVQGTPSTLDTARYAAAVLLDSAGAESVRGIERFVREGGGVILAGDASAAPRVASLTQWHVGKREVAPLGVLPGDTTWRGLSRLPLVMVGDASAVVIERRGGDATLVAKRHYAGRVSAVGYDQTWRWRMAGDSSRVEHREWWSRVVGSVARRPALSAAGPAGAAPLASLHAVLGPSSAPVRVLPVALSAQVLTAILGALLLAFLLAEWLLRRSRGAK
jgi:hypothetical protein